MPVYAPPGGYRRTPHSFVARVGTRLSRVHRNIAGSCGFSDQVADSHFGGSRFDPTTDGQFSYLYAAYSDRTAVAETLLRGLHFDDKGARLLPRAAVRGWYASEIELTGDLNLLSLQTGVELAAVGQDNWLIHCGHEDYAQTRRWACWLREKAPWAQGIIWPSKRDLGGTCVVLFGDRCASEAVRPDARRTTSLDDLEGAQWLNRVMAPLCVTIHAPRQH
jgi:hypothetical protein